MNKKRRIKRIVCIFLCIMLLFACVPYASAATPSSSTSAKATLAYTLKNLPLGRAVQNFYIGETYIYVTQRVDAITYLSRLKISGNEAYYLDCMTFNNCGHGQSLDFYTYNGKEYFYMGCKSNDDYPDYYWSLQIARFQYQAGKTYNYTDLNRLSYMNYANASATKLGTTYRVACCVAGNYTVFRIQTKDPSAVTYSGYSTSKLNQLLDASKSVDMRDATAACVFSFTQSGDGIILPNGSFQGIEMSSKDSIYLDGGAEGDTPQIARMTTGGSYKKLISISNVGTHEIEGLQCDRGRLYFVIIPETTSAAKKNGQQIWYLNESTFGISHTLTNIAGTAATCTKAGLSNGSKCSTCGFLQDVQEVLPAKGHTSAALAAVAPTCTSTGLTAGAYCSVCNEILTAQSVVSALGHSYDSGVATQVATCTQVGIMTYTCATCGDSYTEEIEALGHSYNEQGTDPTCTEQGYTSHTCANCSDSYDSDYVDALGHTYDEGTITTTPTCTEAGIITYTCTACNSLKTEKVDAYGHTLVTDKEVAPTCTSNGLTEGRHCSVCNEILMVQEVITAYGHTEVIDEAVEPTCIGDGLTQGKHCSVCNEVLIAQEILTATGHSYVYAPNEDETHTITCANQCDYYATEACTYTNELCACGNIEACYHENTTSSVTTQETCTQNGIISITCNECGETVGTTVFPANGHQMNKIEEIAATCTQTGVMSHWFCEKCESSFADAEGEYPIPEEFFTIDKIAHAAIYYALLEPTCTQTGLDEHYKCTSCGMIFIDDACEYQVPALYLTIAATGHTYAYTNNGEEHTVTCANCDYSATEAHDYIDGTCICNAVENTEPEYVLNENLTVSMSISVGAEMQVMYTVLNAKVKNFESFYLEVVKEVVGGESVTTVYSLADGNMEARTSASGALLGYTATYTGIYAMEMGDSFTATLYAVAADGTVNYGVPVTSSIKSFLMETLANEKTIAELKILAVDMLNYGAAAQVYFDYDAENLVNADLTEELKALGTQVVPTAEDQISIDGTGGNITTSVTLQSKVVLYVNCSYTKSENSNLEFVVKDAKTNEELDRFAPSRVVGKICQGSYDNVGARQMRDLIKIELYDNGELVSKTLTWNIESYVAQTRANSASSESLVNTVNAMLNYGDSVAAYMLETNQ